MLTRLTYSTRRYASRKSFYERVVDNLKSEWSQNKEIKENLEKFRKETQKLEETESLKQAREKFKKVEEESLKDVNEVLQTAKESLKSGVDKAKEAEIFKKTIKMSDTISSKAKDAAEGISKQGDYLKETAAFKKMTEASKTVEREINDIDMLSSLYKAPTELMKRADRSTLQTMNDTRQVKPNQDAQSVELHKDSRLSQSWSKFKDENPYMNKIFELKMKYDESDSPLVRVAKNFVDRVKDVTSGIVQRTDISITLTEICKVDTNFDLNEFVQDCEKFIVPTILESMAQNRMDILSDWCHEAAFNKLSHPSKEAQKLGLIIHSQTIDIQNFELVLGKIMEQKPVLIFSFQAHQVMYVTDKKGNVQQGDKDQVMQNTYIMAFCRDPEDFDPMTAWRLVDVEMSQSQIGF